MYVINPLSIDSLDPRLRIFGAAPFRIPSAAMMSTYRPKDIVVTSAWPYVFDEPKINDVIVFVHPVEPGQKYISRIIATGGDTLQIIDGTVIRNGQNVSEPFVNSETSERPAITNMDTLLVPADHYFMMGDNRHYSYDSRYWGFVPKKNIIAKITLIIHADSENQK
jgi:signal peptidase I